MALTTTIDEVKEMLPNFISNLSEEESLPIFEQAEYKYLVPIVGMDLYTDIQTKYDANNLTTDETVLLKKMRLMSVAHSYHDALGMGSVKLTDTGATNINNNGTSEIKKWQFEKAQQALLLTAYDATEVLLTYLFTNKADYSLWTDSDEYAAFNSLLIKSGTDFAKQYPLHQPMRTFFFIRTLVADTQELYLKDVIGKDLLTFLIDEEAPDAELKPCIDKLKKALAYYSVMKCCEHFIVRFSADGFTVLSDAGSGDGADNFDRRSASPIDLDEKKKACKKSGDDFVNKAIYELVQYYNREEAPEPSAEFIEAFEAGPLTSYVDPGDVGLDNDVRKGIYRL